jgi:hypothetical protein
LPRGFPRNATLLASKARSRSSRTRALRDITLGG